jgi:hypothetical protein
MPVPGIKSQVVFAVVVCAVTDFVQTTVILESHVWSEGVGCQAGLLVANAAGLFMSSWRKTWDHSLQLLFTVLGTF